MRTSWKLAGGIAALALLAYSVAPHERPRAEPPARPAGALVHNAPALEPARSWSGDAMPSAEILASPGKQAAAESPCATDCFEQEAGYNWAEQMRVEDPADCDDDSASFVEGCLAYAEPRQAEVDDSWEDR